jgi:hypothetical protein
MIAQQEKGVHVYIPDGIVVKSLPVAIFKVGQLHYTKWLGFFLISFTNISFTIRNIYYFLNYLTFQPFNFDLMKVIPETARSH